MKDFVSKIDVSPSKRMYRSIIADYDLNRSISELIDNAIDLWIKKKKQNRVKISLRLNIDQQTISISDNVGGLKFDELRYIISPGLTTNLISEETIGVFGVGSKRAVVALAEKILIRTRHETDATYMVEYDDEWLKDENTWALETHKVDDIEKGTTFIELVKLRYPLDLQMIKLLEEHISITYCLFMQNKNLEITSNGAQLKPISLENWAYPPNYPPHRFEFDVITRDFEKVNVVIKAGLSNISSTATGDYGVYMFCNDRLIAKAVKDNTVGFITGPVGLPHSDLSLAKIFVFIRGAAYLMPWNSSKSGINPNSEIFRAISNKIIETTRYYTKLSRSLQSKWEDEVFKYKSGQIVTEKVKNVDDVKIAKLPEIPKSRFRYEDIVAQLNRKLSKDKPWTTGLYESMIIASYITNRSYKQKNRIALIIVDSTFEIALKEFLVYESGHYYSDPELSRLFRSRNEVIKEIKKYKLNNAIWNKKWIKATYYNNLRNKLIHERASVNISDDDIKHYKELTEEFLHELFGLTFY